MASVHLEFLAPDVENLATLRIMESASFGGPFLIIDSTTEIGAYPDYITEFTTSNASNVNNWFAIEWIDDKGASTNLSQPLQGNTQTPLGIIVDRVMLRDPSLNREVVAEEAEAALSAQGIDPFDSTIELTPVQERGLTNLTLAMCYVTSAATTMPVSEYVAGIVSQKFSDQAIKGRADAIQALLKAANKDLGAEYSLVALISLTDDNGLCGTGAGHLFGAELDQSRLLVDVL